MSEAHSVRSLIEKSIEFQLLNLEPMIIIENMDITEKIMYLEYLTENKDTKKEELENSVPFEEILKRDGLTINDL